MMRKTFPLLFLLLSGLIRLDAEDFSTSFARGKWDRSQWLNVKSPRFPYVLEMVQQSDHIVNPVPDLPDEEILKKHAAEVYSALVLDRKFRGGAVIASRMSFDHRMAPLLVIAPELGRSADGKYPEFRTHYEIVLFDQGINVWRHGFRDGKPFWHKAAYLKTDFLPKKVYDLQVQLRFLPQGGQLIVRCGGHEFGYVDSGLKNEPYYVGLIACEGRNRFYDFRVTQPKTPKKEK